MLLMVLSLFIPAKELLQFTCAATSRFIHLLGYVTNTNVLPEKKYVQSNPPTLSILATAY